MIGAAPSAAAVRPASGAGFGAKLARLTSAMLLLVTAMALVAVIVAGANGLRVRVEQTGSMAPMIHPGDLVIVRQTPIEAVRVGDVIGVRNQMGQVIVHRVKAIQASPGSLRVTTQGDANPTSERWTLARGADVALVRGVAPKAGELVDAVKGPYAALAVLMAGLLLAMSQLRTIWSRS